MICGSLINVINESNDRITMKGRNSRGNKIRDWDNKKIRRLKEQSKLNLYNFIDETVDLLVDTAVIYFLETYDNSLLYCLSNGIYQPILEEAEQQQQTQPNNTVSDNAQNTAQQTTKVIKNAQDALNKNSDKKGFIDRIIAKLKEWWNKLVGKSNESKSENKPAEANKLNAAANQVKATINQAENKAKIIEKKEEEPKKEQQQVRKPSGFYNKKTGEYLGSFGPDNPNLHDLMDNNKNPDVELVMW